jgi:hypothetical protein
MVNDSADLRIVYHFLFAHNLLSIDYNADLYLKELR